MIRPSDLKKIATFAKVDQERLIGYLVGQGWSHNATDSRGVQWFSHPSYTEIEELPHKPHMNRRAFSMVPRELCNDEQFNRNGISVPNPELSGDYGARVADTLHDLEIYEDRWLGFILNEILSSQFLPIKTVHGCLVELHQKHFDPLLNLVRWQKNLCVEVGNNATGDVFREIEHRLSLGRRTLRKNSVA